MGYVERALAPPVIDAMGEARVVALLGPRQSGKTTLVRALSGPLAAVLALRLTTNPCDRWPGGTRRVSLPV